jgi:uncharacterized membrane protein YgcG
MEAFMSKNAKNTKVCAQTANGFRVVVTACILFLLKRKTRQPSLLCSELLFLKKTLCSALPQLRHRSHEKRRLQPYDGTISLCVCVCAFKKEDKLETPKPRHNFFKNASDIPIFQFSLLSVCGCRVCGGQCMASAGGCGHHWCWLCSGKFPNCDCGHFDQQSEALGNRLERQRSPRGGGGGGGDGGDGGGGWFGGGGGGGGGWFG